MAQVENYNDYSELIIDYDFGAGVQLSGSGGLTYLTANLTLVPLESDRQNIISLIPTSNPNSNTVEGENFLTYTWNEYSSNLNMGVSSQIKTQNILHKLDHIEFPITELDPDQEFYLQEGEKIDINEDIVQKAAEIISGETDLYTVVFKLADWTRNNIEYDLNSLTAKAALESSWVLENRQGVCDEMTSLFISFARSVGIPARFISGTAYTNLDYNFGNHGWAEVYFPGYGWVPYDVTFGEYGWLNPGHVELSKSLDSSDPAIRYNWLSNNLEVDTLPITIDAEVVSEGEKLDPIFDIDVEVLVDNVGPGSYVPFKVTVKNAFDKYVTNTILITKAPSQLKVNDNPRPLLLKPNQDKTSFWIVKIPGDVEPGYVYTSTIEAKDIFGSVDSDTLQFSVGNEGYTLAQAEQLVEELEEEEELTYSEEVSLDCSTPKTYYYSFETVEVSCEVQNTGNTLIDDLEVCLSEDCQTIELNIAQKKNLVFEKVNPEISLVVSANKGNIEVYSFMNILVLDEPDLEVTEFEFEDNVNYDEEFEISFVLSSEAEIKNLRVVLDDLDPISITKGKKSLPVSIKAKGKYFLDEVNMILIYEDEYGNEFSIEESKGIIITNVPWYAEVIRFFRRMI